MNRNQEGHPDELQLMQHLTIEAAPAVTAHVSTCEACRDRLQDYQTALRVESRAVERAIDVLPENFWQQQRHVIMNRVSAAPAEAAARANWFGWIWKPVAVAACMLVLSIGLMTTGPVSEDSDDALLREVQLSIQGQENIGGLETLYPLLPEEAEVAAPAKSKKGEGKNVKDIG